MKFPALTVLFFVCASASSDAAAADAVKTKRKLQKSSKKNPFVPPSGSSTYLIEATKVASKVINQINNDGNDPNNFGVLAHGLYGYDGSEAINKVYETAGPNQKLDWNNPSSLITDSEVDKYNRPYSSSWSLYSRGLKPIAFNAYTNLPVPGLMLKFDKGNQIDDANYLTSPIDCNTLGRKEEFVSENDWYLRLDITEQKNKGGTYNGVYKCNIHCTMNSDGICTETAPWGSISDGNGFNWSGQSVAIQPFVTADAEPKAYVGSHGTGWMNMFAYNLVLDQSTTNRVCTFVREDDKTDPLYDRYQVFDAFRASTVKFQTYLADYQCCSTCNCPKDYNGNLLVNPRSNGDTGFYLETEVALNMEKLTKPGMMTIPGTPNKDRSPIAFGDEMMAVTINTRTCKDYHRDDESMVCTEWPVEPNWPNGTPFDAVSEQKAIEELKVAGCYMSLQLSQEFGRFVPVVEARVLSNILSFGNIGQWSDPKWDDATNYVQGFDCCKIANGPGKSNMKAMYDSSGLAEFKC